MVPEWDAYSTEEAVLDLEAIILKCVEDKRLPTVLLGHSYATTAIIRYLGRNNKESDRNDPIAACIFLSSAVKGGPLPLHNGGHPIFKLPVFILRCLQKSLSEAFLKIAYHPEVDPAVLKAAKDGSNANDMGMCKAYHCHHDWATATEAKSNVCVPCLVVHGKDDGMLPEAGGQHLADVVQGKLVFVEYASHQVMEEQPEKVAGVIWEFLNESVLNAQ